MRYFLVTALFSQKGRSNPSYINLTLTSNGFFGSKQFKDLVIKEGNGGGDVVILCVYEFKNESDYNDYCKK